HSACASSSGASATPQRSRRNPRPGGSARTTAGDDRRSGDWPDLAGNIVGSASTTGRTARASGGGGATDRPPALHGRLRGGGCAYNPPSSPPRRRSSFYARAASGGDGRDRKGSQWRAGHQG